MITVLIKSESHYKVDKKRLKETAERLLQKRGVKGKVEVSVSIVGDRLMKKLNNKYRGLDETTAVLSFPLSGSNFKTPFVDLPDGVLRLGDIVISYPQAREAASEEGKLVDDKIDELMTHGLKCLLGNQQE